LELFGNVEYKIREKQVLFPYSRMISAEMRWASSGFQSRSKKHSSATLQFALP